MADNEEARQAEEKRRQHALRVQEMNQRHLKIAKEMQQIGLEEFRKEAERKQCTFAELIEDLRLRGEDVSPEVEKLLLDAEGKPEL